MNVDCKDAVAYLTHTDWRASRLGLHRMRALLDAMGNPQDKLVFVHVAGTNGKGSVCAMMAGILQAAGYQTGLYTSPYVGRFNERMQVNRAPVTDGELAEMTRRVRGFADAMEDHPTGFELITAVAFAWFLHRGCEAVVLEVGLGGRLDATNVIAAPAAALITAIDLDHTQQLGHTVEEIAAEKAGIIKPGADAVLYPQTPSVRQVFAEVCRRQSARLTEVDLHTLRLQAASLRGQYFAFAGYENLFTVLPGVYQTKNAALAVTAAGLLRTKGWNIPEEAVRRGLAETRWPARFEVLQHRPAFILDGGHNPQGVAMLKQSLQRYFPNRQVVLLAGVMADKDYPAMFRQMAPLARCVFCVAPDTPRALPPQDAAAFFRGEGLADAYPCETVRQGVRRALEAAGPDDVICAFGTFYMAGEVRACFGLA